MKITSMHRLEAAVQKHPDAAQALAAWVRVIGNANWTSIVDLRRTYAHADGVKVSSGKIVIVFNIRGNTYRLLAGVDYRIGVVNVLGFLTHAQYDKDKWKGTL